MAIQYFLAGRFSSEFVKTSFWQTDKTKGYILFQHLPICSQLSFESAAIIGEYFSSKKETFVDLLSEPGKVNRHESLRILQDLWDKKYREIDPPPKDFSDLLMESERKRILTRIGYSMEGGGKIYDSILDAYHAKGNMKIPVMSIYRYLSDLVLLEGFGGGLHYPGVVRELWHNSYEIIPDEETINKFAKYGILSPVEKQAAMEPKPLRERQIQLIAIVREYVSKHSPDQFDLFK